jgi:hypothetical protein
MPVYTFTTRNKLVAALAGLVVLGAGAALMLVGLALLAGVAIAGGVLGTGVIIYRALRGQRGPMIRDARASGLDPSLEVFAEPRREEQVPPNDEIRRIGRE